MSTRDLIDAIASGDSVEIQHNFEAEMASRVAERLDVMRQTVAQNMFKTEDVTESVEEIDSDVSDSKE